jgi:acyl-CoA synthetase (NDP forming)
VFLAAGFAKQADELAVAFDAIRNRSTKPICLSWQAMPVGIPEKLASLGVYAYPDSERAARALRHLCERAENLRHRIRRLPGDVRPIDWSKHVAHGAGVVTEDRVAALLDDAGLPVARGQLATTSDGARAAAHALGYPVAMKGISAAVTHRAAAGWLALGLRDDADVAEAWRRLDARATEIDAAMTGVWVQRMAAGDRELIVTALRDPQFGVVVGCGIGGGMTEVVDDVAFTRAPIDAGGAADLIGTLRTMRRFPAYLTDVQRDLAARFVATFSALAASAPFERFTLEVNPLKLGASTAAAVDGLMIVD